MRRIIGGTLRRATPLPGDAWLGRTTLGPSKGIHELWPAPLTSRPGRSSDSVPSLKFRLCHVTPRRRALAQTSAPCAQRGQLAPYFRPTPANLAPTLVNFTRTFINFDPVFSRKNRVALPSPAAQSPVANPPSTPPFHSPPRAQSADL